MSNSKQSQPRVATELDSLCQYVVSIVHQSQSEQRKIIAIAGPPGSGKSSLLSALVPLLDKQLSAGTVIGIPMDGFHLDNSQLDRDGTRAVKGAPHTFDVQGLRVLVQRLHSGESSIFAPEFDRASDLSRNCAIKIDQAHNVVLIEGNYLLLDEPGWRELADYFTLTISIDVPVEILHDRLVSRWLHYGLSQDDARNKALSNDIPNAKTVVEQSISADIIYQPDLSN